MVGRVGETVPTAMKMTMGVKTTPPGGVAKKPAMVLLPILVAEVVRWSVRRERLVRKARPRMLRYGVWAGKTNWSGSSHRGGKRLRRSGSSR